MRSVNPATGEVIATHEETPAAEVDRLLEAAHLAFLDWRRAGFAERARPMRAAAGLLRAERDGLAQLMAREMGKPIVQGRAEVDKCAWVCEHYADSAGRFLAPEPIATDAASSFVTFQPLGVVLAVMPWNFPLWQVFRFVAPGLMAGNVGVLKHASNVPGCALAIESLLRRAGFPEGVFTTLLVGSREVARIIEHPRVVAATLTGSDAAGRAVAAAAGRALKKTVLELGGSDAYVVLEDADLEKTVATCVQSRLINNGQSCIAAKRFIVPPGVRAGFEARMVELMRATPLGDPLDDRTVLGPQARDDLRDDLHGQVQRSVQAGARLLVGGEVPARPGAWYPASVLTDVRPGMPAYHEELFGPVAAIIPVTDEEEAIRVANDSSFGLGAAVFTRDAARGERIAATRLEAGACFVNSLVKSDPRLPFGGIKASGYGRELGVYGIKEFVNVKTVYRA